MNQDDSQIFFIDADSVEFQRLISLTVKSQKTYIIRLYNHAFHVMNGQPVTLISLHSRTLTRSQPMSLSW